MTASIFKSALEKATAAKENLTPQQLRLLKTKLGDYAVKVYHQFRKEKEVGAVVVAFLIGHPAFYMPNEKTKHLGQTKCSELRKPFEGGFSKLYR